ncbi:hypothetical protein CBR_g30783 [Chara braunii]|uniref:Uncharacterized protein n=1 Tax=Chara braunii TaxID=69332 RepID=A0A388JXJ4_CHABU|nr:hypothetical protein CBR_g30783 [Chara braunii]|eukprot:GBG62462.1 hypothetical protein CBR_g30783 [Chara braunii]
MVEEIETLRNERERIKKTKNVSPRGSEEPLKIPLQQEPRGRREKDSEKIIELNERRGIECANDKKNISCGPSTKMNTDINAGATQKVIQGGIWMPSIRFEENRYKKENEGENILFRTSTETNIDIRTRTAEEPEQGEFWVPSVRFEEDLDAKDNLTIQFSSIRFEDSEEGSYATLVCATEANGEFSKDRTDSGSLGIDVSSTGENPRVIEETLVNRTTTMEMITIDEERENFKSTEDTQDELIEDQDERDPLDEVVGAKISQAFEVTNKLDDNYGLARPFEVVEPEDSYEFAQLFETVEADVIYGFAQLF